MKGKLSVWVHQLYSLHVKKLGTRREPAVLQNHNGNITPLHLKKKRIKGGVDRKPVVSPKNGGPEGTGPQDGKRRWSLPNTNQGQRSKNRNGKQNGGEKSGLIEGRGGKGGGTENFNN